MKNAYVLQKRGINHAGQNHPAASVILDMDDGLFSDWREAGIVRDATTAEVAAERRSRAEAQQQTARLTMARTTL